MILEWLGAAPVILVAALVVFSPGLIPLVIVGVRGLALAALSPVVGVAFVAGIAVLLDLIGIPFAPLSYAMALAVIGLIAWGLRAMCGPLPADRADSSNRWLLPVAALLGVLLGAWSLTAYIGGADNLSQTNDAIFHLNAVRYALETGSASSLHITGFTGSEAFYPAAWHALASMIVQITGAGIPLAANTLTLLIGAVIWPFGVAWLARTATRSATIAAYAAVLSGALHVFPLLMFQWGVLYPNALSIAVLPAALALVISAPRWAENGKPLHRGLLLTVLIGVVFAALLLAQPSTALAWGLISALWLSFWTVRRCRAASSLLGRTAITAGAWLALLGLWAVFARSTSGSHWPTFRSKFEAATDVLINRQMNIPAAYAVSILMVLGLVVALRHREWRWLVVAWTAVSGLYVLVAAVGNPTIRSWVLGPWYADPNRIAALAPVIVIPLAAIGADAIVRATSRLFIRSGANGLRAPASQCVLVGLTALTLLVAVVTGTRSPATPAFTEGVFYPNSRYLISEDTFLSTDERKLLEDLPDYVEPGTRVIGNPSTATGFGYALSGADVFPQTWAQPSSDAWRTVSERLRDIASDDAVCIALASLGNPGYVLDFGVGEAKPGRYVLPGMSGFEGRSGFEFIAAEGDASLWRITACGGQ